MDMADLSALLGEDLGAPLTADVWVVLPLGQIDSILAGGLALIGEARRLADGLGCYVHAVLAHAADAQPAIAAGADRVHVTADPAGYLAGQQPEFVLLPATHDALAAGLAQRLHGGLITGARGPLAIEPDTRALLASHPVYGGDYSLDLAVNSAVKIVTLDPRTLAAAPSDPSRSGDIETIETSPADEPWRDLGPADYQPPAWRPLTKARLIVSAGRGLRDAEGFALARQLAEALGAELAGDRSARDSGWVDEAHEVGVNAHEVAPDLYLAVGIQGDTIHNAAIASARRVLAICANPAAPIFSVADLGWVGEPKDLLPRLISGLKS